MSRQVRFPLLQISAVLRSSHAILVDSGGRAETIQIT